MQNFYLEKIINGFLNIPILLNVYHFQLLSAEIFLLISILYLLMWIAIKSPKLNPLDINIYTTTVLVITLFILLINPGIINGGQIIFNTLLIVDNFTIGSKIIIITFFFFISILAFHNFLYLQKFNLLSFKQTEFSILILLISFFACILVSSFDLITLYLSLEGLSLLIFILLIFNPRSHNNIESGVKYFCLSVFMSCFLGFGISIIYGIFNTTNFLEIHENLTKIHENPILLNLAISFIFFGFLFKLGAAPFHIWISEVYAGTETIITTILIIPIKLTFFFIFCRLSNYTFFPIFENWKLITLIIALSSILIGAIGALWQDNIKKFIAFTSVNQIGFSLLGIASGSIFGLTGSLLNLFFYSVANLGFFAFLLNCYNHNGLKPIKFLNELSHFSTNYQKQRYILSILILSMAGIPPLVGFFGKFLILLASIQSTLILSVFFGLIITVISAFYYVRLIKNIFFDNENKKLYMYIELNSLKYNNLSIFLNPNIILISTLIITSTSGIFIQHFLEIFSEMSESIFYPLNNNHI